MSIVSFEGTIFSRHFDIIFVVLTRRSAIVTSRKRKLRELFAVATQVEALPSHAFANPDAPAATQAEWQFLQANDILQYVLAMQSDSFFNIPWTDIGVFVVCIN